MFIKSFKTQSPKHDSYKTKTSYVIPASYNTEEAFLLPTGRTGHTKGTVTSLLNLTAIKASVYAPRTPPHEVAGEIVGLSAAYPLPSLLHQVFEEL